MCKIAYPANNVRYVEKKEKLPVSLISYLEILKHLDLCHCAYIDKKSDDLLEMQIVCLLCD